MRESHKRLAEAGVLAVVLVIAAFICGCAEDGRSAQTVNSLAWRVLSMSQSDAGGHRALYYYVLVRPGCDRAQLEDITREIVRQAKRETSFSKVWIQFYDYPELHEIGYAGPPLGYARYGGTVASRTAAQNGDYAEMTYTYMLSIPDWDERPSQRDVDLAVYRLHLARQAESHGRKPSERKLVRLTAQHFGVRPDVVVAAVARVDDWVTEARGRSW